MNAYIHTALYSYMNPVYWISTHMLHTKVTLNTIFQHILYTHTHTHTHTHRAYE